MNDLKEINELVHYLEDQLEIMKKLAVKNIDDKDKFMYFQGKRTQIEETLFRINNICMGE